MFKQVMNLFTKMRLYWLLWRLGLPKDTPRQIRPETFDIAQSGRWQALDDLRMPKPHTEVKISNYYKK